VKPTLLNVAGFKWAVFWIAASSLLSEGAESAIVGGGAAPLAALYKVEQAEHGREVYDRTCAACHGLRSDYSTFSSAGRLFGEEFIESWSYPGITVDDLFFFIRTTMPPNNAGALSEEEHADVTAFVLSLNRFPAGNSLLKREAPGLAANNFESQDWKAMKRAKPSAFIEGPHGTQPKGEGPSNAELLAAASNTRDWLYHTHDYQGARFVDLDQINAGNVGSLRVVAAYQVGELANFQTGPLVYRGTIYVTTPTSTIALDATTLKPRWQYTWKPQDRMLWLNNRGVALKDGRVVRGTPDGYLMALDAANGDLLWARQIARPVDGETITMAPLIFDDLILVGPAGSENKIQGWIAAFRLSDGSPVWRFHTVPRPGEPGSETWISPKGVLVGGGAIWTPLSLDPETGELFVPVTNPAPDLSNELRRGDNLYCNSVVVLDVHTGRLKWYRQVVPNDSHDYDLTQVSPLFRAAPVSGEPARLLVATVGKDGLLRVLDRTTHEIVYRAEVTTRSEVDTPVSTEGSHARPGVLGGVEWNGPAYDPARHMLFVPAVDWGSTFTAAKEVRYIPGKLYLGGSVQMDAEAHGWITAIDARSGQRIWRYRSDRPVLAALTATAGGLVFGGELTGDFIALESQTGQVLYRFNTGGPMGGGIVTYAIGGKQYVAVASGRPSQLWMAEHPGTPTVFLFALP
jgi:alcohol dehydrogenase (cytochrome c)